MIEQKIGLWNNVDGLKLYESNMWRRRGNLHGAVVRFTCQPAMPILNPDCLGGKGFLLDMLEMLKTDINITVPLGLSVDGKFGGKTKNGSFNGGVGMLTRNETDVFLASLAFNLDRGASIYDVRTEWGGGLAQKKM